MNSQYIPFSPLAGAGLADRNGARQSDGIQGVLQAAECELEQLMQQRTEIMKRIVAIKRTIVGITQLRGDAVLSPQLQRLLHNETRTRTRGLTDSCRRILIEAAHPLSARAICVELEQRGCPVLSRHKDPVASVTTILNRLARYGEACVVVEGGRNLWRCASDVKLSA